MLFHSKIFNFNIFIFMLLGIFNRVEITLAHQCYVCGGSKDNLSCENFDPNNKSFVRECKTATSCIIHTDGDTFERSCAGDNETFDDCKTINQIKYCYCLSNLCNDKMRHFGTGFSDDEDEDEGSGISAKTNTNQKEQKPTIITNRSNQIQFYLINTYIFILALLCY